MNWQEKKKKGAIGDYVLNQQIPVNLYFAISKE